MSTDDAKEVVNNVNTGVNKVEQWFITNSGRLITLAVAIVITAIIAHILCKLLRHLLDNSNIPSASIFVNLLRVLIWVIAAAMVLKPVFGINPTTIITALGVGGVAISLGLKDTVANVIGGFSLMIGRVIGPGDHVSIQGITGTVKDITWRQTVIESRGGDQVVVPNSVLNTTALTKLTPSSESLTTVDFTMKDSSDPEQMSKQIIDSINKKIGNLLDPEKETLVKFTGFTPYGLEGHVLLFAKEGVLTSTVQDQAARVIAMCNSDYLVSDGGSENNES